MAKNQPILRVALTRPVLLAKAWQVKRSGKTFLSLRKLLTLSDHYLRLTSRGARPVAVAEFGVGRGGSAILLAWLVHRRGGSLALFDVFGRIPPPSVNDGEDAQRRYQAIVENPDQSYYGNIPDLLAIVRKDISEVCPLERVRFIQGQYERTLPALAENFRFDLVHIDCDWYESARTVLDYLRNHLQPGAILQIDDYFFWKGANQAVDEAEWLKPYNRFRAADALIIDTGQKSTAG